MNIPFNKFENIHKLLRRLANIRGCKEPADMVENLLRHRLAYAKTKMKIAERKSGRKTVCLNESRNGSPNNDDSRFGVASVNDGMKDSPANHNNTDTSASADISMVKPSMEQVCSWLNDGANGDICVDEITIEEIKIDPSDDSDLRWHPPSEKITKDVTNKAEESSQSESSFFGKAMHNQQQYRRLRCNYCSLLFYSDKTLTNHQKKCREVYEQFNPAPKMPIAEKKEVDSSIRSDDATLDLLTHQFKGTCTSPVTKRKANLEVEDVPSISKADFDPLACDLVLISPPPLVPLTISPPGLSNSLPTSIQDALKPHHPTFVDTAPLQPLQSTPIDLIPPPLAPFSSDTPVSIPLQPTVSSSSRVDNQWPQNNSAVPQQTIPSDITVQLERIKNEVALLKKQNCRLRDSLGVSTGGTSKCFDFKPLDTHNQLKELEENLGKDATFADELVAWLKAETAPCDPKTSIARSIDCLFTRQLFANCTWRGLGWHRQKFPLSKLKNILTLLERVASTLHYEATAAMVEHVLRTRLKFSTDRVNGNPARKAHCMPSRRKKGQCEKKK
ncbi:uncharacterized protein LOC131287781 [Anopheles ziemanni]|nr:uncharacterized protein LOC131287781 [Anopheles ziemanni]